MKKNVSSTDAIIRVVLAAIFAVLYFTGTVGGTLGLVLMIAGAIFLITGVVNFCPIYAALGIRTRAKA